MPGPSMLVHCIGTASGFRGELFALTKPFSPLPSLRVGQGTKDTSRHEQCHPAGGVARAQAQAGDTHEDPLVSAPQFSAVPSLLLSLDTGAGAGREGRDPWALRGCQPRPSPPPAANPSW